MYTRRRALAAVLLALGAAVVVAPPVTADAVRQNLNVSVDFHDPGLARASNPMIDCAPDNDGVCSFGYDGVATMRGTWTGSTVYRAEGRLDGTTGDLRYEVWETFTGTVAGCGEGTFKWHGVGTATPSAFDVATQTVPFSIRLWLVEGSGTGDLVGITGTASGEARFSPLIEQTGHLTGRVTCAPAPGA